VGACRLVSDWCRFGCSRSVGRAGKCRRMLLWCRSSRARIGQESGLLEIEAVDRRTYASGWVPVPLADHLLITHGPITARSPTPRTARSSHCLRDEAAGPRLRRAHRAGRPSHRIALEMLTEQLTGIYEPRRRQPGLFAFFAEHDQGKRPDQSRSVTRRWRLLAIL